MLIRDWEEKGSDVNLVTRLLVDGFNGEYEHAVVMSNDGDFRQCFEVCEGRSTSSRDSGEPGLQESEPFENWLTLRPTSSAFGRAT